MVHDLDLVGEGMGLEDGADEGHVVRVIVYDDHRPRWRWGGRLHNGISSRRARRARDAKHRSTPNRNAHLQNSSTLLLVSYMLLKRSPVPISTLLYTTDKRSLKYVLPWVDQ